MGRYAVTAVFEVGPGKVPHGADVLDRMRISDKAVHRFSYCDGRTLTAVIDWSAASAEQASADMSLAVRLVWAQLTGIDPGTPLSVRVRSLTPMVRVSAGVRRGIETVRPSRRARQAVSNPDHPDDQPDVHLDDHPDEGPDDGGLAGVREPRRPKPGPGSLSAASEEPRELWLL